MLKMFRPSPIRVASNWCHNNPVCEGNLGVHRSDMPQIRAHVLKDFIKWVEDAGYSTSYVVRPVDSLRPTQVNINLDGVNNLLAKGPVAFTEGRPPISSGDGYILDGHHRWAALMVHDPSMMIRTLQVNAPIRVVLDLAHDFPKVEYSN